MCLVTRNRRRRRRGRRRRRRRRTRRRKPDLRAGPQSGNQPNLEEEEEEEIGPRERDVSSKQDFVRTQIWKALQIWRMKMNMKRTSA